MAEGTDKTVETKAGATKDAAKPTIEEAVSRGVAKWIDDNLRNTAFSRDTDAWNILQKALPKLPGTIAKEVK